MQPPQVSASPLAEPRLDRGRNAKRRALVEEPRHHRHRARRLRVREAAPRHGTRLPAGVREEQDVARVRRADDGVALPEPGVHRLHRAAPQAGGLPIGAAH
ncbi:MAG: hypothetical protein ACK559_36935, partial [bacterium]